MKPHRNLIYKDCLKRYNFPIYQNEKQNEIISMKIYSLAPFALFGLYDSHSILVSAAPFTSVNDITCDNLPIKINTTTVLDGPVDLSICSNTFANIFEVENDAIVDCNGHNITGQPGPSLDIAYGTAFHVIGGATII